MRWALALALNVTSEYFKLLTIVDYILIEAKSVLIYIKFKKQNKERD